MKLFYSNGTLSIVCNHCPMSEGSSLPRYAIVGVVLALRPGHYRRGGGRGEADGEDQEVHSRIRRHRWTRDLETHFGCKTGMMHLHV